jgi:hypothetical protein
MEAGREEKRGGAPMPFKVGGGGGESKHGKHGNKHKKGIIKKMKRKGE